MAEKNNRVVLINLKNGREVVMVRTYAEAFKKKSRGFDIRELTPEEAGKSAESVKSNSVSASSSKPQEDKPKSGTEKETEAKSKPEKEDKEPQSPAKAPKKTETKARINKSEVNDQSKEKKEDTAQPSAQL